MKSILHQGHLGIEVCKKRACQSIILATYKQKLEDMISKCPLVQHKEIANQVQHLTTHGQSVLPTFLFT